MRLRWIWLGLVVLLAAAPVAWARPGDPNDPVGRTDSLGRRPPRDGYFRLHPPGSWSKLPGNHTCAARVHRSRWEVRPENRQENHAMPDPVAVHRAFADRPRSGVSPRWNRWLLPRVDGQFTGTTDEILQWAACKWGLPDNLLRAIAVRESTWYTFLHYRNGRPVPDRGSGDVVNQGTVATRVFCAGLSVEGGVDYQRWYGAGRCPETFSIMGVKSWQDPGWGRYPRNQNGTFPFNRDSTAFAADYAASQLRGCYEGWEWWLENTGDHSYAAGHLWGCVGAWFAGSWRSQGAHDYVHRVRVTLREHTWLRRSFAAKAYKCDDHLGCPV